VVSERRRPASGCLLEQAVQIACVEQTPAAEGQRSGEAGEAMMRGLDALEQEYK
jgi:hypothetical protein